MTITGKWEPELTYICPKCVKGKLHRNLYLKLDENLIPAKGRTIAVAECNNPVCRQKYFTK